MSYKYIPQLNNENFVFPNFDLAEYDVDIIHSLNENSVSGTVTNFVTGSVSSSEINIIHDYTWSKNGADVYINSSNQLLVLSVHAMAAGQTYYKPWRLVDRVFSTSTGATTLSGNNTVIFTPSQMGLASFSSGTYYFEIRFIGLKSIYPVCQTLSITIP